MAWIWAILFVVIFLHPLQKLLTKNKNSPPGPKGLPILGHLYLLGKNPHHALRDLAKKHGPIMGMRLGLVPAVVVSSPTTAELILKTHDHIFASRPSQDAAKYIGYGQRGIAFGPYGSYWRNLRKLCTLELLSGIRISQFQGMRNVELGLLVESLKQGVKGREIVDLSAKVFGLIGNMNSLMVFGRKFDDVDLDEIGFKAVITETLEVAARFNLADYFPFIGVLDIQGLNREMKRLSKIFDGFFERIIDDHVRNKKGKDQTRDFVDIMMTIMESGEAEFEFDRRHVKAVLLDMLIAGTDASATAIEWAISELIRHPEVMRKLQEELESVVGLDHMVDESHLDKLKYLDHVVKEALRLHPSVPLLIPHESMEDCIVEGFHIRKKSRIIVNVWAIGRDPNVWPNPEEFSPERHIGSGIDLKGRDFELLPFGSGRRSCPGINLGLNMVKSVLAQLVHCFDWKLPEGTRPTDLDMTEHFGLGTCRANHLMLIPHYRLKKVC